MMKQNVAVPMSEVEAAIREVFPEVKSVMDAVAEHPEVGFKEFLAADAQEKFLKEQGFQVTRPIAKLPTAVWGTYEAVGGKDAPQVALLTEYDALVPPLNHACGHQLILGAGLLALTAVRNLVEKYQIPGTVVAACCPGEEQLGGKIVMLENGLFQNLDAVLLSHPFHRTGVTKQILAVSHWVVEFFGRSAHASTAPYMGINALDAMHLFFDGINAWRQQLESTSRVHGIVTNGGQAANVIPEYTSGFFYVRSADNETQKKLEKRFYDIAHGAALMTGCDFKVALDGIPYSAGKSNPVLIDAAEKLMDDLGLEPDRGIYDPLSTDFANVCETVPGLNLWFNVTQGKPYVLHSAEFREAAAAPEALPMTLKTATVLAKLALDLLTDEALLAKVRASVKA